MYPRLASNSDTQLTRLQGLASSGMMLCLFVSVCREQKGGQRHSPLQRFRHGPRDSFCCCSRTLSPVWASLAHCPEEKRYSRAGPHGAEGSACAPHTGFELGLCPLSTHEFLGDSLTLNFWFVGQKWPRVKPQECGAHRWLAPAWQRAKHRQNRMCVFLEGECEYE